VTGANASAYVNEATVLALISAATNLDRRLG